MTKVASEILDEAAATYRQRNTIYGSNYLNVGEAMKGFFPNGVELKTPNDHLRFHLFSWIVGKLSRYANQWQAGHQDSIHDVVVYAAMLEANPPAPVPLTANPETTVFHPYPGETLLNKFVVGKPEPEPPEPEPYKPLAEGNGNG